VTDDQHGEGTQDAGGRWDPLPQGEYDDGATAFVELPEGGIGALLAADSPLAAPGHGYVPPPITVTAAPAAATDPAGAGNWAVPAVPGEGTQWPDPSALPQGAAGEDSGADDRFRYRPVDTQQWNFQENQETRTGLTAPAPGPEAGPAPVTGPGHGSGPGHDVTGHWSIPVAGGDLPDESGEFTTSSLVQQWGGTPPATLPGGAPAPWATDAAGHPWGPPQQDPPGDAFAGQAAGDTYAGRAAGDAFPPGQPPVQQPAHEPGPVPDGYGAEPAASGTRASEQPTGTTSYAPDNPTPPEPAMPGPGAGADATTTTSAQPQVVAQPPAGPDTAPLPGPAFRPAPAAGPTAGSSDGPAPDTRTPAERPEEARDARQPAGEGAEPPPEAAADPGPAPAAGEAVAQAAAGAVARAEGAAEPPAGAARPGAPGAVPEAAEEPVAASGPVDPEAAGAAAAPQETDPVQDPPPAAPRDEHPLASYVLRVNGVDRPVTDAWIGESLLYVLRERLGLAGAKDGCSQGECGACNVQVDGRLVASCLVPAVTTAGSEVRTVEGLAADGQPSDVQRALARCGAVQCGFCVPGMAMTVHDLLEGNPEPTEMETRQALSGNLCRCSGYRGVLRAVAEVVAEREARAATEYAQAEQATADGGAEQSDADEPRIPHQAGPGAGGVHPSAFDAPHPHDPYGQDGGQA
jgi:aerobic-type carbon monoxide dehydrogenase small subunit (CoxS/CutS family)